jgi:hypothetical protein
MCITICPMSHDREKERPMSKTLRDLQAAATHRRWSTEEKMNDWLD